MIWLTWRNHRVELLGLLVSAAVVAVAIALAADFAHRTRLELGVDSCVPTFETNMHCFELSREWIRRVGPVQYIFFAFYVAPALVGSFIGGPLFAREFERATDRLAWTQSIGRVRWVLTTLGVPLAAALAAGGILALVGGQTRHLIGLSGYRPWDTFDQEGPAFLAFMIFGLAAGAFFGAWQRRILAGMFLGLLAFALVRVLVIVDLRPYYEPPIAVRLPPGEVFVQQPRTDVLVPQPHIPPDAWLFGADAVDGEGRTVPQDRVRELIEEFGRAGCRPGLRCDSVSYLAERDVYQRQLYQPADRYWRFQFIEAAIYLALTAAFVALTVLLLRRRDA
jgi:hypothetical protein